MVQIYIKLIGLIALIIISVSTHSATLNLEDKAAVKQILVYLNKVRSFEARFIQISHKGSIARGKIYMQRPGRMRIEYDSPVPILIVSTGKILIIYDNQLDEVTYLPLSISPISVLLDDKIHFNGRISVIKVKYLNGRITISIAERSRLDKGLLHLTFSTNPIKLREWIITDARRQRTKVILIDFHEGVKLNPKLFLFERITKKK